MPDSGYWQPGDQILLRDVTQGRVWTVRPVPVVEATLRR